MQHDVQALLNEVPMHTAVIGKILARPDVIGASARSEHTRRVFTTFNNGCPVAGPGEGSVQVRPVTTMVEGPLTRARPSFPVWFGKGRRRHPRRSLTTVLSVAVAGLPLALTMTNPSERRICSHHHRLHHLYCTPVRWDGATGACRSPSG
jgi:hypothetical protein